ncbi:MAG: hypothetical protein QG608_521 [Actinomycetota bacterium]|nr:hypothetical protein [Actinomycetota bacterium]
MAWIQIVAHLTSAELGKSDRTGVRTTAQEF